MNPLEFRDPVARDQDGAPVGRGDIDGIRIGGINRNTLYAINF